MSSTSSKASDYSINGSKSPTKALLLNKVVVGKGEKLTADSPNLTAPPTAGYDSVSHNFFSFLAPLIYIWTYAYGRRFLEKQEVVYDMTNVWYIMTLLCCPRIL